MLECELGYCYRGGDVCFSTDFLGSGVDCLEDLTEFFGVCYENFRSVRQISIRLDVGIVCAPFTGHGHDADSVFGIGVDLCLEDSVNGVGLSIEARWMVVAVAHILRIIDNHHCGFQRHFGDDIEEDEEEQLQRTSLDA